MNNITLLIAYYRVSTKGQGHSGLGLAAQQAAVAAYALSIGARVLRSYTEVESGRKSDRPELARAMADARRSRATLVVAKLDRLARSVSFTQMLLDSRLDFICCDNPHANRMTIQIMAVIAENEARVTSERTRDALAEFKQGKVVPKAIRKAYPDGVPAELVEATAGKLGSARTGVQISHEASLMGTAAAAKVRTARTKEAYSDLTSLVRELQAEGLSLRAVAAKLNEQGYTTRTGCAWNQVQVSRVLKYAA